MHKLILLLMLVCSTSLLQAQRFKVHSWEGGLRWWEVDRTANNPIQLIPLLRTPGPYIDFIRGFFPPAAYNTGITGNPGLENQVFLFGGLTFAATGNSYFSKHFRLTTHLLLSLPERSRNGTLFYEQEEATPAETFRTQVTLSLKDRRQYGALDAGIHWRSHHGRPVGFTAGLQLQGTVSLHHSYTAVVDTVRLSTSGRRSASSYRPLPLLEGKALSFWQAYVPLGVEWQPRRSAFYLRTGLSLGILRGQYRPARWEAANGLSLTVGRKK